MNAKRELGKLLKAIEELGLNKNDVAEKAGHNRFYFANALLRVRKNPDVNLWANPIKHMWEVVHQEQAKQAVQEQKGTQLELKFDEPAMRLVFDDDSSALPVAMPPPKPAAQQPDIPLIVPKSASKPVVTGEDTLRGLIHKQLDKMGVVQLALLLAHIAGNE